MPGETKMIIITSDEDIIRQFAFNKNKNTHIINLDNDKQATSTTKDNNHIIDLDFLAGLSQLSSRNDQVYKRALESSDHKPSKSVKTSKKSDDFICTICGDYAIGFNYNVPSCASCKAFFHRNANQPPEKIKCLTGQGQCSVTHEIRRKCTKCRLDRCLAMGMRRDFVLTEEQKQQRKIRLEENRNITAKHSSISESGSSSSILQPVSNIESLSPSFDEIDRLLMDMDKVDDSTVLEEDHELNQMEDISLNSLSVEDWMIIESVRSSFVSTFRNDLQKCCSADVSDQTSALITWSHVADERAILIINFFRQIDEFEGLHTDDRFILIKYNIVSLTPIYRCFCYDPINNCFPCGESQEAKRHREFYMLCFQSNGVRGSFINLVLSFVEITEQDPILLSLLLIILLFSQGLSMSEDEPSLNDPLAVYRAQSYYTRILWNYMINKHGETKTCKQFTRLLTELFRIQSATKEFREFLRVQLTKSHSVDRIAPLMQTVLNIS